MAQPPTGPDDDARIMIAVPAGPLRDRLEALLRDRDVLIDIETPTQGDLGRSIQDSGADLVVVRRRDLADIGRGPLDRLAEDDQAPDVLVVGPDLDEQTRVELVAAGATDAIPHDALDAHAAQTIEDLAIRPGSHAAPDTADGPAPSLADFVSRSKQMQSFMRLVRRVADTDSSLLVVGETGVGKEHLIRAMHAGSVRADAPFVLVNCGALPEQLLESELFGHAAGAFTGAKGRRRGCFEQADGGLLFLDEIGEMPTHLQVKLLSAIQRREIQPLGAERPVQVDVRIAAATNRDLRAAVEDGSFREDLFYRLNVVELRIPPLRERKEDLPVLIGSLLRHFRARFQQDEVLRVETNALETLLEHDWPGNVRELINVLERASLVCEEGRIQRRDLPRDLCRPHASGALAETDIRSVVRPHIDLPWKQVRAELGRAVEREYFAQLLEQTSGAVGECATRAGISPRSLYEKLKRHGLRKEDFQ